MKARSGIKLKRQNQTAGTQRGTVQKHLQIGFLYLPTVMPKKARGFSVLKLDQMQSQAVEFQ